MIARSTLRDQLNDATMPCLTDQATGMAPILSEHLWAYVQGDLSEEELTDFLIAKLESADNTLYRLEEEIEYPEAAFDCHQGIHKAFVLYHDAFHEISDLMLEDVQPVNLPQVIREFVRADELVRKSQQDLDEMINPPIEIDGWAC